MRIALTTSLVAPIRAAEANGPHAVVIDLARGLEQRGHKATIYAAAGSAVPGLDIVEIPVASEAAAAAVRSDGRVDVRARRALRRGFEDMFELVRARGTDIVSQHAFDAPAFELSRGLPTVHTLHLPPIDPHVVRAARRSTQTLVTVSQAAARSWQSVGVERLTVIRNGVAQALAGRRTEPPFALVAGRVSPEKGTDAAIRIARAAGLAVVVVGDIYDRDYYERVVAPLLPRGYQIQPLPRAELSALMGRAAVTVMPILWEETFGLVAAESQMSGCPVVGYHRGALPEVVIDGIGGYLVEPGDEAALRAAVAPALALDRQRIAADARARLGVEPMIAAYERLFTQVAGKSLAA